MIYFNYLKVTQRQKKIVKEIRKTSQFFIDEDENMFSLLNTDGFYKQPDEKKQIKSIEKLLERGINIEIVKTPVFVATQNKNKIYKHDKNYTMFQVETRLIDTTLDKGIKNDVKTIFMFCWVEMKKPNYIDYSSMVKFATSTKKMYLLETKIKL